MFGKYRAILIFWAVLLVASLLGLALELRQLNMQPALTLPPFTGQPESGGDDGPSGGDVVAGDQEAPWTLLLSVVTAVISAAGFVGTTFFALRNDRRQAALHDLQVANLRTEIERQELEIARLRREQAAASKKPKP